MPINRTENLALNIIEDDDDDLDIYIEDEEEELDELDSYFKEKRASRQVSNLIYIKYFTNILLGNAFNVLA